MMEAGVLLDSKGEPIFWHVPPERSGGSLPDSRDLWDVIWENRENISGFAHSHPGSGRPGPSHTDVTTFAAVEAALGRRLEWIIISQDELSVVRWAGPHRLSYATEDAHQDRLWLPKLRELSGYGV